jgi:hypothetical protein
MNKLFMIALAISTVTTGITFGMNNVSDAQKLERTRRYFMQQQTANLEKQRQQSMANMTKPHQPTPTPAPIFQTRK